MLITITICDEKYGNYLKTIQNRREIIGLYSDVMQKNESTLKTRNTLLVERHRIEIPGTVCEVES